MRIPILAVLLMAPPIALAQDAAAPRQDIPLIPGVETVNSGPGDWHAAGTAPEDYSYSIGPSAGAQGKYTFFITARPGAAASNARYGTFMQKVRPEAWLGKRIRLSARLKSENVSRAQMWMRVDGKPGAGAPLSFDNMGDRPLLGSNDWKLYEIVLDVPPEATAVAYGFFIAGGRGTFWADAFVIEEVGKDVPVNDPYHLR